MFSSQSFDRTDTGTSNCTGISLRFSKPMGTSSRRWRLHSRGIRDYTLDSRLPNSSNFFFRGVNSSSASAIASLHKNSQSHAAICLTGWMRQLSSNKPMLGTKPNSQHARTAGLWAQSSNRQWPSTRAWMPSHHSASWTSAYRFLKDAQSQSVIEEVRRG